MISIFDVMIMTEMRLKVVPHQIFCEKWHIHPQKNCTFAQKPNSNKTQTQMLNLTKKTHVLTFIHNWTRRVQIRRRNW